MAPVAPGPECLTLSNFLDRAKILSLIGNTSLRASPTFAAPLIRHRESRRPIYFNQISKLFPMCLFHKLFYIQRMSAPMKSRITSAEGYSRLDDRSPQYRVRSSDAR